MATAPGTRDWLRRTSPLTLEDDDVAGTYFELERRILCGPSGRIIASAIGRSTGVVADVYHALAGTLPVPGLDWTAWDQARPEPTGPRGPVKIEDPIAAALFGRLLTWSIDLSVNETEPIWASDADEIAASLRFLRDRAASAAARAWSDRVRATIQRYIDFYSSLGPGEECIAEDA